MKLEMTPRRWLMGAGAGTLLLVGGLAAGPVASFAQGEPNAQLSKEKAGQIAVAEYPDSTVKGVDLEGENGRAIYEVALSNGTEVEVDGNSGQVLGSEKEDGNGDDDAGENEADQNADSGAEQEDGVNDSDAGENEASQKADSEAEQEDGKGDNDAGENEEVSDENETAQEEQEQAVPSGTIDDGQDLLSQASITLEQAISTAQGAADGAVGEVDVEYVNNDQLVFNVDIGSHDVKVDAHNGAVVSVDSDD